MVNQEYLGNDRISQTDFHFFPTCSEICYVKPLDKPNVEVIFCKLTLIPLHDGSGRKSFGLV